MTKTAHKYGFEMLYERERETTARLRALNAELLAALKEIIIEVDPYCGPANVRGIAKHALAKAKGE
jgi:hypothetical protein